MRKWFLLSGLVLVMTAGALAVQARALRVNSGPQAFLPISIRPPEPVVGPILVNGSFEEGWLTLPPVGNVSNQQPNGWELTWVEIGQPLFDSPEIAHGVCECLHKLVEQLPPHEQPGGTDPLILDGTTTYKVFHGGTSFGSTLAQTITGVPAGTVWQLRVPVRAHHHGGFELSDVETGVWVNDVGSWVSGAVMGDRTWYTHELTFTTPEDGEIEIVIRFKSRIQWRAKDFFIDDVQLEQIVEP